MRLLHFSEWIRIRVEIVVVVVEVISYSRHCRTRNTKNENHVSIVALRIILCYQEMLVHDALSSAYVASACSSPRAAHTDSRATKELAGCAGVSSALTNRSFFNDNSATTHHAGDISHTTPTTLQLAQS